MTAEKQSAGVRESLKADHTREAIRIRLGQATQHSYLRDFVYGGIDGAVTTFAVVSGVAGADLSTGVVIILGMANLVGDGFSMAASNYLGSKADLQVLEHARRTEELHIAKYPEGEREEVRQIMAAKGFAGQELENIVATITADQRLWVNTMLQEELGLSLDRPCPWRAAVVTFLAFISIGVLPLLAFLVEYVLDIPGNRPFLWSTLLTGVAFFAVGAVKARFVSDKWYRSGTETLLVGSTAAGIAYIVGWLLSGFA
ncbi:MAG: VIT1/CCC1 transporter family protein [Planctomycetaceae bacterium]|nr:VIT1/CCC1 transporter family protein [Planctomycetaceae bacterium]